MSEILPLGLLFSDIRIDTSFLRRRAENYTTVDKNEPIVQWKLSKSETMISKYENEPIVRCELFKSATKISKYGNDSISISTYEIDDY